MCGVISRNSCQLMQACPDCRSGQKEWILSPGYNRFSTQSFERSHAVARRPSSGGTAPLWRLHQEAAGAEDRAGQPDAHRADLPAAPGEVRAADAPAERRRPLPRAQGAGVPPSPPQCCQTCARVPALPGSEAGRRFQPLVVQRPPPPSLMSHLVMRHSRLHVGVMGRLVMLLYSKCLGHMPARQEQHG
jgi:hypothetical protein